jgi:DNA-binding transcriptional LysR family regulator
MSALDYVSLRLFGSVIACGNIAKAARANHIAPSAISKRISDLEDRIGVPLLRRLRDGVEPTDAGQVLYRHILAMNQAMDRLQADLSEFTKGARGRIRLWANTSAVTQFLPEDLKAYVDQYPEVRIDLREDTSLRIVEAIRDGDADLGIYSGHIGEVGVEHRVYRRDTLMVIVPIGHPLAGAKRVTLAETAAFDHVGLQAGSSLQDRVQEAARQGELDIRVRVQVFGFDGVRRMVEAGLGVAILPYGAVVPHLAAGTFGALELDEPWATRTLYVGFRDARALPLIARQMVEILAPSEAAG